MKYKLSMIIPIYKVEKYIEECLNSIFSQLPDSVEIIIINDGTPDRSIEIIKSEYSDWLVKDQVVLLEQKNAGPSAARNSGLDVARGEYIGFLDSDDILLENYFSTIFEIINTAKIDIVEFGFERFYESADICIDNYSSPYRLNGLYALAKVRTKVFSLGTWFPSTRIYKRAIFEQTRFPVGMFYEDVVAISQIYLRNLEVYFLNKPLIGYRVNPNSTTSIHTKSNAKDMYTFYISLTKLKPSISIDILKIRTARTIAYFYNELNSLDFPIMDVFNDVKKIKKRYKLLKSLKFSDLLFFILPKIYMLIDKIRLKRQKEKI